MALVVGGLLLGWRDRLRVDLSDQLAAVLVMFVGVLVATLIEVVEFVKDQRRAPDLIAFAGIERTEDAGLVEPLDRIRNHGASFAIRFQGPPAAGDR